jgi:signal peptidase I
MADERKKSSSAVLRTVLLLVLALLVARVVLVRFIVAYKIPSASMAPTLLPGDHVFVKKWPSASALARGALIVFRFPEHRDEDFVFRVVALPGQTVELRDRRVLVDGKPMPTCFVGRAKAPFDSEGEVFLEWIDGRPHLLLFEARSVPRPDFGPFRVPDGQLFVLGDNRNNSRDSAFWFDSKGGGVPFDDVRGRVSSIWQSSDSAHTGSVEDVTLPSDWKHLQPKIDECLQKGGS